ncbi:MULTISPECIES: flagellar filament capping protein FliD [unclassified Photobacterium]|uniref:flagellar filament capping protein FliD n=1 Tax=unclassified Photobacterium TaxID=2628852 RepID=UPI000D16FBB7|nr:MULTISPECIES: flagellar filament capping protein FliD [unclassified Photobacterium]PSV28752.1 flagellar hook protein [Photobacterium sp. GB-56]PSV33398.1 flagellar hook protein [Photobacterium sp. GB-72]PSV39341.1 flagellar hook protein [Photobacterium sp. GB-27]PSV40643.1 flagellar hook protein [Photobacterium sp. GB-210]PSV46556.1 flagellar hook protein [Photobacterium sp. GB-36]
MGLSAGGLASGLDVAGMTQQLVAAERTPKEQRIKEQQQKLEVQLSGYGQIKSAVSGLEDMVKKFAEDKVFAGQSAKSSEKDFVSVEASDKAKNGSYTVEVLEIAKSHKVVTNSAFDADPKAQLGSGDLEITVDGKTMSVTIDQDKSSLKDVLNAINNSADNPGVTATVINDANGSKIVFSSTDTGVANEISIDASGMTGELAKLSFDPANPTANADMVEMQNGVDAKIKIDNFTEITSSSNKIEDAIEGVTLDIKKLTNTDDVKFATIDITNDTSTAKSSIEDFVEKYNEFIDTADSLSKYDTESKSSGPLNGDSLTRSIISQMRNMMNAGIEVDGRTYSLSDFGITTDRYGKIEIDDEKLDESLKDNFNAFNSFFHTDEKGFLDKAEAIFKGYTSSTDGSLTNKEKSLKEQQDRLNDDMDDLNERMKAYEERTYQQFTAMDAAIGKMNNQLNTMMSLMTF